MAVAKDERWILLSHLLTKYKKLPSQLEGHSLDNWYPEERMFLFYLDAYWGKQGEAVQIVHLLKREIKDAIYADKFSFLPESIKVSTQNLMNGAPNEKAKQDIQNTLNENITKYKRMKIDELLDNLKEFLSEEGFASYKNEVDRLLINANNR